MWFKRTVLAVGLVAFQCASALAQNCTPFTDVPASDPFCSNIQWMFNRGVTLGCATNQYCPAQFVRRDQMAAFMNRLADKVVFQQGGNAFGANGVLGTTDNQPLDIRANNARVMRYEPNAISPNVIGGSPVNNVTAGVRGATIGGGGVPTGDTDPDFSQEAPNRVTDAYGTVGGGYGNSAGDDVGTIADAPFATVGGGRVNVASGPYSVVAGGYSNTATGNFSGIGGGYVNTASGENSHVAGGEFNIASGRDGFAAGSRAQANADGCFVWGDTSTGNPVQCNAANRFVVRSLGGVFIFAGGNTQPTYTGVFLGPGATAWNVGSDRNIKDNLRDIDTQDILRRVLALPITTWNLKAQDPAIRHIGPTSQDFRAAFGLGETELGINTLDADGVALAAIQGLNAKLEAERAAKNAEITALRAELADLRSLKEEVASHPRRLRCYDC